MTIVLPSTMEALFCTVQPVFSSQSFLNFGNLVAGWILCQGRHTISRVLQAGGCAGKHHSALYRFFSRARWCRDSFGQALFRLVLRWIPGRELLFLVDDTLCRRSGPHLWGAGMHHDPLASTYVGRGRKAHVAFAFGHSWVVVAIWVPFPWNLDRGVAIPVLFRLYRSKKRCLASEYRKRTDLARELAHVLASWIPSDRKAYLIGDAEYACKTLNRDLPDGIEFIGPMNLDAALYDPTFPKSCGRGRPRTRGPRLPSPQVMARSKTPPWRTITVAIYNRKVKIKIKTRVALWYSVCGTRPIRMVYTRDPKGVLTDRVYFSTDTALSPPEILIRFSRRWSLEVTFYNTKQDLGLGDPQNGWGRRKKEARSAKKRPGPQARGNRGRKAVESTTPMIFFIYGLVHLWYFKHGSPRTDVSHAREKAPWYRNKKEPSFKDVLAAARRAICRAQLMSPPMQNRVLTKTERNLIDLLVAA